MVNHAHKEAVTMCRFWWARYRRLPRWRLSARRKALVEAEYWGARAIELHSHDE